jgi:uncharacterized membrane protein YtjA (UPF0391 family)
MSTADHAGYSLDDRGVNVQWTTAWTFYGNFPGDTRIVADVQLSLTRCMEATMLYWALVFLVIALVAAALGFGGVAGAAAGIAQILFYVFLVLLLISLVIHFTRGTRV